MRIAVLEDDPAQAELMRLWFLDAGHECQTFAAGQQFIKVIGQESFDLLVIDWMLPDINGDKVLAWVREHIDWPIPVLFITQRDSEEDIVYALEKGADDIMTKPVTRRETLARIFALGRRAKPQDEAEDVVQFGGFRIDCATRAIENEGTPIDLTGKEFDLAVFLFRNCGRILSRGHILESVWGRNPDINTRTVDTHVSRLRKKLNLVPERGWRLTAIYQHGYRLERLDEEVA